MKITSRTNCMTADPQMKWRAGEEVEVEEEVGKKLLTNRNFYLTRQMVAETGKETNDRRYRKKR